MIPKVPGYHLISFTNPVYVDGGRMLYSIIAVKEGEQKSRPFLVLAGRGYTSPTVIDEATEENCSASNLYVNPENQIIWTWTANEEGGFKRVEGFTWRRGSRK